jgi:hypothetical protein
MPEKQKLRVSVSGGRTSLFMAKWLLDNKSDEFDFLFMFANTTREHHDTYRFLRAGVETFGIDLHLIEAEVHHGVAKACTGKRVGWDDLRTNGELFEEVVSAYGLPNQTFKLCTRELKTNPMDKYAASIGFGDAMVAIGIRADEKRRVSKNATKHRLIYPLVDMVPTTKLDVLEYFEQFDWDLRIPEWLGNCVDCHKKSDRKLQAVLRDEPRAFEFALHLDQAYSAVGPNNVPGPRKRWRGYRNTRELLAQLGAADFHPLAVTDGGCSESCEVYETEEIPQ